MQTIGQNIAKYRKEKNITQEKLSEICDVTPQAVSKWENDISCPDVTLLKRIARTFGISVDELLDDGEGPVTRLTDGKHDVNGMILRLCVEEKAGDKVNINLPVGLIELLVSNEAVGNVLSKGKNSKWLETVDFRQILELVSLGVAGKLLDVKSADGDVVEVYVE